MATVPGSDIPIQNTILGQVQREFQKKGFTPYVLHRLDFETSGVLLFGKMPQDRKPLEAIFGDLQTQKKYIALVIGTPHGSVITKNLRSRASGEEIPAQTYYKIIRRFGAPGPHCTLVEAEIKTGRKHQIRQHFAHIGHPIILDSRYGDVRFNKKFRLSLRLGRQFLHAAEISFFHPFLKKIVIIKAPLTLDLQSVLKKLDFTQAP